MNCFAFLGYEDPVGAIDWLERAFGFARSAVHEDPDGNVVHAELRYGDGIIMLGPARNERYGMRTPKELGAVTQGVHVFVDEVDQHHERARAAGAEIVREPLDADHGSRDYMARDPEGNLWSFGTYRPE